MTMELDPRSGAPFISKAGQANPDDVLRRLIHDMPRAADNAIWKAFKQAILEDEELTEACLRYYFINAKTRIERVQPTARDRRLSKKAEREMVIATYKRVVTKLFILDTVMPNGKMMRECTFGYIKTFGGKCAIIAGLGQPDEVIGETVSDKQVKAALKRKK